MKILFAFRNAQIVGGIETYLQSVLPYFVKIADVGLIFVNGNPDDGVGSGLNLPTWRFSKRDSSKIINDIGNWRPDLIFNHGIQEPELISGLKDFPLYFFPHDYHATCISGLKRTSRPLCQCERKLSLKCLVRYLPLGCGGRSPFTMVQNYMRAKNEQKNFKLYRKIFVVSEWMRKEYIRAGFEGHRIFVLPFFPAKTICLNSIPKREFTDEIMFVGRLVSAKGWSDAIELVMRCRDLLQRKFHLNIAGDGPDREKVLEVAKAKPDLVSYLGNLDSKSLAGFYSNADALLVLSKWPEPFGLVGIEAMSQGVPSIAYQVGGISQWLDSGVTGEMGPYGIMEPSVLTESFLKVLGNHKRWQKYRERCLIKAMNLTVEKHVESIINLFHFSEKTVV
jgi:glycosyltransferase involved in cell wall biosynthesis